MRKIHLFLLALLVDGPDSIVAEAVRFAGHMNEVAGMDVQLGDAMVNTPSLFVVDHLTGGEALAPEGYTLKVTSTGVTYESLYLTILIVHTAIMASARRVRNIHQKLMPIATKSIVSSSNECDTPR